MAYLLTCRPRPWVGFQTARSQRNRALSSWCFASYTATSIYSEAPQTAGEHRAFVPLLDPRRHSVPFAVALELHGPCCSAQLQQQALSSSQDQGARATELLELRYLLAGCGQLLHRDGRRELLQAGDSVLMPHGAALCEAAPGAPSAVEAGSSSAEWHATAAAGLVGSLDLPPGAEYSLVSLVVYFHQSLLEAAVGSGAPCTAQQQQQLQPDPQEQQWEEHQRRRQGASHAGVHPLLLELLGREWADAGLPPSEQQDGGLASVEQGVQQAEKGRSVVKRALEELPVFQLPRQSNRLALAFDPVTTPQAPLVFGVEVFEGGHRTPPHVHTQAHELFFIVSGEGTAFCERERMRIGPGDLIVFDPGAVHGIDLDVLPQQRMYCLELMLPNDSFAEVVRAGQQTGGLEAGDFEVIAMPGGCGAV